MIVEQSSGHAAPIRDDSVTVKFWDGEHCRDAEQM